jgi:hypothetical protein
MQEHTPYQKAEGFLELRMKISDKLSELMQRKAMIGAFHMVYLLTKEERVLGYLLAFGLPKGVCDLTKGLHPLCPVEPL